MNTIKTYKERLDANYPHPERHPEIVRQYVDEEITELRERVAYLESYTESQKDAMRVTMDELATVREALKVAQEASDCNRAILAARTESMNRFMQERDALQAKLEALQANDERYLWWVETMTSKNAMDIISDAFKHLPHDVVPTVEQFAEVVDAARKGKP